MSELPKIVRQRLQAAGSADVDHPDANLLTGFLERSLSEDERTQVLEHLAGCADCRDIVTLALPQEAEAELGVTAARVAASSRLDAAPSQWWRWSMVRWGALAAGVVIVAAAVLVPKLGERQAAQQTYSAMPQPISKEAQPAATDEVNEKRQATAGEAALEGARAPQAAGTKSRAAENKTKAERDALKDLVGTENERAAAAPPGPQERAMADAAIAQAAPEPPSRTQSREEQVTVAAEDRVAATPPAGQMLGRTRSKAGLSAPQQGHLNKKPEAMPAATAGSFRSFSSLRWSISADGKVQRSQDSGRNWEVVPIAQGATFRAVSAVGPEVWAGGAGGALFHSTDGGEHWSRLAVRQDRNQISGDVVRIEFSDPARGVVVTSTGETWATEDGGQTWQRR